jgi:hypothetical protein
MVQKKAKPEKDVVYRILDNIDFRGLTQDEVARKEGGPDKATNFDFDHGPMKLSCSIFSSFIQKVFLLKTSQLPLLLDSYLL